MAVLNKGHDFSDGDQVTAAKLDNAVDAATFASGAVDNASTQLSGGAIIVKDAGITAAKLAANAVTTDKILDANVTTAKILDANITTAKIADANVTAAKIADANVTAAKIAANAVTTDKILDANVTPAKLSAGRPNWNAQVLYIEGDGTSGGLEINSSATSDGNSFIDFHSDPATNPDFDARIVRGPGVNGRLDINQRGSGAISFYRNGSLLGAFSGASGMLYLNGTGARNSSGNVLTSGSNTVGQIGRNAGGYIEFFTDIGAVGTTYFVSDENKKDNIKPSNITATPLINSINFIEYDWKEDSGMDGHVDIGVSAQQLRTLNPSLIHEMSDGGLQVNPNELLIHTVKALQEALLRIEALENA
jgi:hypothetical protein